MAGCSAARKWSGDVDAPGTQTTLTQAPLRYFTQWVLAEWEVDH